jgi:UDP-2,4-diacetamido-2,4,6-trideoxy-beta-L-altropyranose hydrolase
MDCGDMKHIYIRVDGNEIIATGHVMRCLSIAEQIRKLGAEVTFIVADGRPCSLIEDRGFSVDVLGTQWDDLDKETEVLCSYVKKHQVEVLLLDTYYVTKDYLQKITQYIKIVYVDDLNRFAYPVHTLINYGVFTEKSMYESTYQEAGIHTHFLIGSEYIPLREEFAGQTYEVRDTVEKILITTGGTDQLNVAGNLLERIVGNSGLMGLEYHVIVGCFNRNKEKLYSLAANYSNIYLHENVTNMSEWMNCCDVAISAAGTTTYELCACGIPSICLEVADNQEGAVAWEKNGYMSYAGNAAKAMEQCMSRCVELLSEYVGSYELRKKRSERMQDLVDGCGAMRIAEYVIRKV